jgi:hypothetical protein
LYTKIVKKIEIEIENVQKFSLKKKDAPKIVKNK